MSGLDAFAWLCLLPVAGGSLFSLLTTVAVARFMGRSSPELEAPPPVTLLKPVCGLEKGLEARLRSACIQAYPSYQVIFCVQRPDDPALPILHRVQAGFGPDRVDVVVDNVQLGPNGKVNNLLGAIRLARHDVLVISDSDVDLRPDYLKAITAPLADRRVGASCTLFKNVGAETIYEKLELLTINADFIPSVIFAELTGAAIFCLGPSVALRRESLDRMGGFEALADYLAEDFEISRRIWAAGERMALVPYVVDAVVDLRSWRHWWTHQVYWDQNTRAANPIGFFATILTKAVPFALLFALLRGFDTTGLGVLGGAIAWRVATGAVTLVHLGDRDGLAAVSWLPLRDLAALGTWALAFTQRTVVWRGVRFKLRRDGRMVAIKDQT